jgi:hypothetical protein
MHDSSTSTYKMPTVLIRSPFKMPLPASTTKRKPMIRLQCKAKENKNILSLLKFDQTPVNSKKGSSKNILLTKAKSEFKQRITPMTKSVEVTESSEETHQFENVYIKDNSNVPFIKAKLCEYLADLSNTKLKDSPPILLNALIYIIEEYRYIVPEMSKQLTALIEYSKQLKTNLSEDNDFTTMQKLMEENITLRSQISKAKLKMKQLKENKGNKVFGSSKVVIRMPPLNMHKLNEFKKTHSIDYYKEVRDSALNESEIVGKSKFN